MNDVFAQPLAVGDDVAFSIRGYLRRGRIVKINKVQARVAYNRGYGSDFESSVYPMYIVKMVEGDHKPVVEEASLPEPAYDDEAPAFVFNPAATND